MKTTKFCILALLMISMHLTAIAAAIWSVSAAFGPTSIWLQAFGSIIAALVIAFGCMREMERLA